MLTRREIRLIAEQIAEILLSKQEEKVKSQPIQYTLTAEEKAKQLGISVSRLYKIKHKYPYLKEQGKRRILFA